MTIATVELDKKRYGQLLARALPHVIHTEDEWERLTNELMRLNELADSSREEKGLAELLTVLIDEYETRRYPIPKASPQQTLRHLMEGRELTQQDLWKVFGSKGLLVRCFTGKGQSAGRKRRSWLIFFTLARSYLFEEFFSFATSESFCNWY
jgi:HTH-type transcriptional regulator/antitoxin HigA